jgi:hypothetical protein
MYAYDSPTQGINIVNQLEGHDTSKLAVYSFPELVWAVPKTRQPDPEVKAGQPSIHLYKLADRDNGKVALVVDAASGYPLRYVGDAVEWTYTYKTSDAPIIMPEKLQAAWTLLKKPSYY